jgi:hypothetical protein
VDDGVDFSGIAGEGLVDGVVHHLIDQVVQTHLAGRADIHGRAKAHGLQPFQNLDIFTGVAAVIAVLAGEGGAARNFSRHRIPIAGSSLVNPGTGCGFRNTIPD